MSTEGNLSRHFTITMTQKTLPVQVTQISRGIPLIEYLKTPNRSTCLTSLTEYSFIFDRNLSKRTKGSCVNSWLFYVKSGIEIFVVTDTHSSNAVHLQHYMENKISHNP